MRRLEILSNNEIKFIHSSSMRILQEVGVSINNARALSLLNAAGAEVDFKKKLARLPEDLVESMVNKAPNRITLCGRASKNLLRLGSHTHTYFQAGGLSPFVRDVATGKQRKATKDDVINLVRLVDFLPHINAFWAGAPVSPQDVRQKVRDLVYAKLMFENTEKHCGLDVSDGFSAKYLTKMASVLMGSEEELSRTPIISCYVNPLASLTWFDQVVETLFEFARLRLPIDCTTGVLSGLTGPATLAGSLALSNAEVLTEISLTQLVNEGTPVSYFCGCSVVDMKSGKISFSAPEQGLLAAAGAQMARYYKLPAIANGMIGDMNIPDIQSGYERATTAFINALAGVERIGCLGLLSSSLVSSYEQLVIDDEIAYMLSHYLKGINVDEDTVALDVIKEVGPGGNYLHAKALEHTVNYIRREHWIPELTVRPSRSSEGKENVLKRSKEKVKRILKEHKPEALDRKAREKLQKIIKEASNKIGPQ